MTREATEKLYESILKGEIRAAARAMRWVDNRLPGAKSLLKSLYPHSGKALVIGITGNPGSGKSTVVDCLVQYYRSQNKTVGVVAVDPSSPFSGGAILGDRIRMQQHYLDPGVFIRSLATRGYLGGLSASTLDTVTIMDAMGRDIIIVETVGVGQDEVDIVRAAHATVVVVVPGLGDEIQALKAGVLEIADVYCINKADRDGVERLERDLQSMQELDHQAGKDFRPMIRTIATQQEGILELAQAIEEQLEKQNSEGDEDAQEKARIELQLRTQVERQLTSMFLEGEGAQNRLADAVQRVLSRSSDPYTETDTLVTDGMQAGRTNRSETNTSDEAP